MRIRVTDDPMQLGSIKLDQVERTPSDASEIDFFKRLFDIIVAATALVALSPVILLFALLIRLQDGGKAIFAQARHGYKGETFKCYKLRTMSVDANARLEVLLREDPALRREWLATQKLQNDPRITKLGRFLRKSSIDELPQLWNVLMGEMSIVGPRPIVEGEIKKYGDDFRYFTSVRPGLTGLWQVEGRTDTTYKERVAMDVRYAQTRTFWNDIWIVLKTIPAVLMSRGAF